MLISFGLANAIMAVSNERKLLSFTLDQSHLLSIIELFSVLNNHLASKMVSWLFFNPK